MASTTMKPLGRKLTKYEQGVYAEKFKHLWNKLKKRFTLMKRIPCVHGLEDSILFPICSIDSIYS